MSSIFDNLPISKVDLVKEAQVLKTDQANIAAYQRSVEGVGLESLEASPAHKLVMQSLQDRYRQYAEPGVGNEALTAIAVGAIIGGGLVAYKKLMRAKNNPITKSVAELEKRINDTYSAKWLVNKKPVEGEVSTPIAAMLKGTDLSSIATAANKFVSDNSKLAGDAVKYLEDAWKKIEPLYETWKNATDKEAAEKAAGQIFSLYPEPPYKSYKPFATKFTDAGTGKITALTSAEFAQAVELLKSLVTMFDTIDELMENAVEHVGTWDDIDDSEDAKPSSSKIFNYCYAEYYVDHIGRDLYLLREIVLKMARGVEEWIVKSFK